MDRGVSPDQTAAVIDREIGLKSRKRGLSVSKMVESLSAM
jgi:hypothetical protein